MSPGRLFTAAVTTTDGEVVVEYRYDSGRDTFTVEFTGELLRHLPLTTPLQHALWNMAVNHRVNSR